jgi:glycosyltransferase involved in cell wall biosynthesis
MPVYNGEKYLAQAIDSIIHQTYSDFELLILDDGSNDSSPEIAEEYARSYACVRSVRLPHSGLVETLNTGIELTSAEYIARMDADDIALPERIGIQVAFLDSNPAIGVVGTNANVIDANGRRLGLSLTGPTTRQQFLRARGLNRAIALCHPTVMFRRALVASAGGYRKEFFPAEDLDLWNRLAETTEIRCLEDVLLDYRLHSSAVTATSGQRSLKAARLINHNIGLRRRGLKELSAREFDLLEKHRSPFVRFKSSIQTNSELSYSAGVWMLASGQKRGAIRLAGSFLLNPGLVVKLAKRLSREESQSEIISAKVDRIRGILSFH